MNNLAIEQVTNESVTSTSSQWVTFYVDQEKYAIDVMRVQEVIRVSELSPVPGAPDYVMGIINLRGEVAAIIDMRKRLGLPQCGITEQARIIIVDFQGRIVGFLVDSVADVTNLVSTEIDTAPNVGEKESARYISGIYNQDGRLLILIDVEKMLTDEEWNEIDAL
jgi:purine-binding chemotaxis protein CheW